ncbi:MAG TPA: hypothetical protein VG013_38355 [Gemmataceae bacterium]|jgi:hypothetical protein|nr:hypothetical protein [Gemmataceae bacterium]
MPLKLNVGLSRKVGEANYGSRGATVNVELEVDSSLVSEPAKLQEKIRQLFGLVRTSLAEELNGGNGHAHPPAPDPNSRETTQNRGTSTTTSRYNSLCGGSPRPATPSQVKAIYAITRSQRLDLTALLQERFRVGRPDALTIKEASQLIDELKSADTRQGG